MTREERENVLHCLKAINDEEVCEECNLYGTTGTDHCQYDMVKLAIEALSEPTKTEPTTITENMTNGDVIKAMFPNMRKKGTYCEFFFDDTKAIQTNSYMHVSEHWFNAPYKGNFTMPTRPKAKWIERDLESYNPITRDRKIYVCSNCHLGIDSSVHRFANYCPNCGAEMESE